MAQDHFVIIGNGPAGKEAAATLRERLPRARITLINRENVRCYQPNLLPQFIAGSIGEEELFVCPFTFYREHDIKLRAGQRVVGVNFQRYELTLDHKEVIPFTGLIIAVGGKPRIPERLYDFADLLLTLKTLDDAKVWIDRLAQVDSVLVVGGDLTSLALTKELVKLDKKIRFAFNEEAFWPVRCNEKILAETSAMLRQKGVEVMESRLRRVVRRSPNSFEVVVGEQCFETGIVGGFYGLTPDVRFLLGSGLHIERGILVDEHLNTGFDRVYAAGDCAQVYHPELRDYWVSIGYTNAERLGRIAASNLAGGLEEAVALPESIFVNEGVRVNTTWWMEA
jgi:NADPH-dependent 2,4-dienoyl-CoA reductase/sulfur reductase-like enzyme